MHYLPGTIFTLLSVCTLFTKVSAVLTSSGDILGHPASKRPSVIEYMGVPFAQAPSGERRFAALVRSDGTGTFNATNFVPIPLDMFPSSQTLKPGSCPYISPGTPPMAAIPYPYNTDNFDPIVGTSPGQGAVVGEDCLMLNVWAKNSTESGRALMVFFYGGRFDIGGTNSPFYNGQYLADSEDVVVTVNYRTNIFEFPGAPNSNQNLGLLDQRLALEWIFGQSAGGVAVDYHAFAFAEDPIAAAIIAHSGTALSFAANTPEIARGYWMAARVIVGCASKDVEDDPAVVMQCMRSKDFRELLVAEAQIVTTGDPTLLPTPPFQPTVDNVTVFADYAAPSSTGQFAKLPYLVGSTDNEAGLYRIPAPAFGLHISDVQWDQFNLAAFTCPASRRALSRAKEGIPTWRYRYFGDWDNLRLFPGHEAYHGNELEMIFGTEEDVSGQASSVEERVSRVMRRAWETLVCISFEDEEDVSFVGSSVYDEPCAALGDSLVAAQGAFQLES